jgi:bifunctional non-homologous end joining protein LigD
MDLDPDPSVGWSEVVRGARELRALFDELGLVSFVKTTGGKGLHVVVPVARRIDWEGFKGFTRGVAQTLAAAAPDRYTVNPLKAQRVGKIFIDYLRNGRGATAIGPYSTRARPGATVAVPVAWNQLDAVEPASLTVLSLPTFLAAQHDDPWAKMADVEQSISAAMRKKVGAA